MTKNIPIIIIKSYPNIGQRVLRTGFPIIKDKTDRKVVIKKAPIKQDIDDFLIENNIHFYEISQSKVFNDLPYYKDTLVYYDHYHINDWASLQIGIDLEKDFVNFVKDIIKQKKGPQ